MTEKNSLQAMGETAKQAAAVLAHCTVEQKNQVLRAIADQLRQQTDAILAANQQDMTAGTDAHLSSAILDRLKLDTGRINAMITGIETVIALPDPVGLTLASDTRPNDLRIDKVTVPLGVIGVIFESRPNVAIDAAILCLKAGNACILRGGSDAWQTTSILIVLMQDALLQVGLPIGCIQSVPSADRELVGALLTLDEYVDVIVPRGGKSLVERVRNESRIPVFSHLDGICHTYIHKAADPAKAIAITVNAKMRRTGVCGATECLVLHEAIVETIGRDVINALINKGCSVKLPTELLSLHPNAVEAQPHDYGHEFLSATLSVKIVKDTKDAVVFINKYGSHHTDAIITEDTDAADYFLSHVESAIAVHNASTQFADGGEFGMGGEIGIATGKLHARGPVGLAQLVTYQYRLHGNGQIRS